MITSTHRLFRIGVLTSAVIGTLSAGLSAAPPVNDEAAVWADQLWAAALEGDNDAVESFLKHAPHAGISPGAINDYHASLARWTKNQADDVTAMAERREAAWAEMIALIEPQDEAEHEAKNIIEAMRLLAEVQELSANVGAPLDTPEVQQLLATLRSRIDAWKANGQLMPAQEGVYHLKAVYEDAGTPEKFAALETELKDLSEQVMLLRRYAFEHFHKMFIAHAVSRGETPREAYSPRLVDRWREEVGGIDFAMAIRALELAENEHVERVDMATMLSGGLEAVADLTEAPGLESTFDGLADEARVAALRAALDAAQAQLNVPGAEIDATAVLKDLLQANAATVNVPRAVILREFVDGSTDELDRFSDVIWPFDNEQFQRQMEGEFVGVGIQIQESELGEVKVISPLEGKPAFFAGVEPDDIIIEVDGQPTAGWTVHDAVRHITGPRHTTVVLGLQRDGEDEPVYVPIVRDVIRMPTVKGWSKADAPEDGNEQWNWFIDPQHRIGYIKLTGFDKKTYLDIRRALARMRASGALNGLVLDLRHNPGGLLDQAAHICNLWVPDGPIVTGEDRNGERTFTLNAFPTRCFLAGTPTTVLVNQGSASASEIVAGCLQAHGAAVVIGDRSFGKGSVQTVHGVGADAHMKVTSQYYRLPSDDGATPGRLVHRRPGATDWGVVPDLIVDMSLDDVEDSHRLRARAEAAASSLPWAREHAAKDNEEHGPADINRLLSDGFDPQLELALLVLQAHALAETSPTPMEAPTLGRTCRGLRPWLRFSSTVVASTRLFGEQSLDLFNIFVAATRAVDQQHVVSVHGWRN